ncbi:hypothetical protein OGAPHI_001871 [Ogataea philodendri]|uniref:Uncharacterized protein n=1 Tax=Ogataea philodendri TaxID=1378263 RepID=A0A9P8P9Y4_9ASCO|nr:uncharacterized protein OGAPHI_001871 [Ogataea philodendri]KAH3668117.1 hypothetical protein OGAPHI_001871 [Ogataea philodendri]
MITHDKKNLMKSTTDRPLRFALLGPHNSSKSSIVSIVSSHKSLGNYYPTIQNSPTLLQFQPSNQRTRALLDVNITYKELEELHLVDSPDIQLTDVVISAVKKTQSKNTSSESVLARTLNYYDLDYSGIDGSASPLSSRMSPLQFGSMHSPFNSPYERAGMHSILGTPETDLEGGPQPYTTPILLELIDTPGVQPDDLIPFLERSLDSRLARDVLRNLAEDNDGELGRARVKPLLIGSGISDLNGTMDGYLICYSCVPETQMDSPPPSYYEEDIPQPSAPLQPLEIVKAIKTTLEDAWKEYLRYHHNWEVGKEYDVFSLNRSLKTLWSKSKIAQTDPEATYLPPITIAVTHCDHELASPVLIEEGRKLAAQWGFAFVQVECPFENWKNVEECIGLMIRESIESQLAAGRPGALKRAK